MTTPDPVGERLARIETKLDVYLAGHTDHESRIRSLERARWAIGGLSAAGGGGLSALLTQLMGG